MEHPAKYTDKFIPIFAKELENCPNVLDPFGGTGKIGLIKKFGYNGTIYCNEIEQKWLEPNSYNCDILTFQDAEFLEYDKKFFSAICTSPTYGNRMADHHNAKDGSKRITYTHCLGEPLQDGNTGQMQWGKKYCDKHTKIYAHLVELLKDDGLFILNISDHIRKGEIIPVSSWHLNTLLSLGYKLENQYKVETPRNGFGANANLRVNYENIFVLKKCVNI